MAHQWRETIVKDQNGNEYQAFYCDKCDYTVVAFPHPELGDGGTMHLPEHRMILIGKTVITAEDAERAAIVWGIPCKVG